MARKPKHKDDFLHLPEYPGGNKAIQQFIAANLRYPEKALENKVEGTVLVSYRIGFDGSTGEIKVLKGIGHGCDEEAVRVVKLLQFSTQNNHGMKVTTVRKIRIHFKLPARPAQGMAVTYEIKPDKKSQTLEKPVESRETYTYTITI